MASVLPWLGLLASGALAVADVTFVFDYSGSPEFSNGSVGASRRASLEDAAEKLGRVFDHTASISIEVTSENNPASDTLASAASDYGSLSSSFVGFAQGTVMKKILSGVDDNGTSADGFVDVNFGVNWDLDDEVSPGSFDFKSTIIHELLHTIGMSGGVDVDGYDYWGSALGAPSVWEVFDDYLSDKLGNELINDSSFVLNLSSWNSLKTGGASPAGGLFFNGPMAKAANGGQPVGLYSPTTWEEGSSASHLDDDNPDLEGSLMLAAASTGFYRRSLTDIERGILMDLGYSLNALPDPRIEVVSVNPGVSVSLQLTGPEDRWYVIESSENLSDWDDLETLELTNGSISVPVPITVSDTQLFFRMRETTGPELPSTLRLAPSIRARR